jgi:tetratricopeptide (TPR) repeat protein
VSRLPPALLLFAVLTAPATTSAAPAAGRLAHGFAAYRAGEYHDAARALRAALAEGVKSEDWAAFLLGESEFYDGDYKAARAAFERAGRAKGGGRPAAMAPFRIADCQWMLGDRAAAAKSYDRLLKKATPATADVPLLRFRIAEELSGRDPEGARKRLLAIAREFPAHPLADEALRRAAPPGPTGPPGAAPQAVTPAAPPPAA